MKEAKVTKHLRERIVILEGIGFAVRKMVRGKGSHIKLYCNGPNGEEIFIATQNLGDPRTLLNFRSDALKRYRSRHT